MKEAPEQVDEASSTRGTIAALMAVLFYQGYAGAIAPVAAPWIARSFGLDESQIARVFACLALAAFGALALSRMVDRVGRRRVLLWCAIAMPVCALGAAAATRLATFIALVIALNAFGGASLAAAIVIIAEELPIATRARGQSLGGLAAAVGAGLTVFLMPVLVSLGRSWRWLLLTGAGALVIIVPLASMVRESSRWERRVASGDRRRSHFYDVFVPLYRQRSVVMLICTLLAGISSEGVNSWAYFHAVSVVGLPASTASVLTVVGGGIGLVGFPLGAWSAERFGRVPTIVVSGMATAAGAILYFWGPPAHIENRALWLGATFCLLQAVSSAVTVASNAAVTELFPTALRGTIIGWFAIILATASLSAEVAISLLAKRFGGLSIVTGWLALLAIPGSILFGLLIDETRGLSLEAAANEDAFESRRAE